MLKRFEKRKLKDRELRILQGVLQKNSGHLEQKRKQQKELKWHKKVFKEQTMSVTHKAQL